MCFMCMQHWQEPLIGWVWVWEKECRLEEPEDGALSHLDRETTGAGVGAGQGFRFRFVGI